jgi:hypothetical protein
MYGRKANTLHERAASFRSVAGDAEASAGGREHAGRRERPNKKSPIVRPSMATKVRTKPAPRKEGATPRDLGTPGPIP